jgi:hypothetical protein
MIDGPREARSIERCEQHGRPFQERQREHFRRDMQRGRVVELHDTTRRRPWPPGSVTGSRSLR